MMRDYIQELRRTICWRMLVLILLAITGLAGGMARADDYADYLQAEVDLRASHDRIRMDEAAVGQVLREALDAKYGEMQAWEKVDQKMMDLGQTIENSREQMSRSAGLLLRANPSYRLPEISLGHPFDGNLTLARNKKREWIDLANRERGKLLKLNDMLAKVDMKLLRANQELVGDTLEGFLPDEKQLAGEAGVIVLGAYFGPPGLATAGLVYGGVSTFNAMINLYYGAESLAQQAKALAGMKEVLLRRRQEVEKSLEVLADAVREIHQVEQLLEKNQKRMEEYRLAVRKASDGLDEQARNAFQAQQEKLLREAREEASKPKHVIALGTWIFGMTPIAPLQPGEWSGEVDAIVGQMDSYAKAVEDGGDPDNYYVLISDWLKDISGKILPLQKQYDLKMADYRKAEQQHWVRYSEAGQRASAAWSALWSAYHRRGLDDAFYAAADRIGTAWNNEVKASENILRPYGQALIAPYRELVRLHQISWAVESVEYRFTRKVETAVSYRTGEFWREYSQWQLRIGDATAGLRVGQARIPGSFSTYRQTAENLDAEVTKAMEWGDNVEQLRNHLLAQAEAVRQSGNEARDGYQAYQSAMAEVRTLLNTGESELDAQLARYGKVINYPRTGRFHICFWCASYQSPFEPDSTETTARETRYADYVDKLFQYEEPPYLAEAAKADWNGVAERFAAKAEELKFHVDQAELYRYRLAPAEARLGRISLKVSGVGLYAPRPGSPEVVLRREFSEPAWAALSTEAGRYIRPEAFAALPWARWQPLADMLPWQKLYAAQTLLLNRVREEMKPYVQARGNGSGWFAPISEAVVKPIEADWTGLRALCETYDSLAAAERLQLQGAQEALVRDAQPVFETWGKMAVPARGLVTEDHARFQAAYGWLSRYLETKDDSLKTLLVPPNNSIAVQLDDLVLGYRPAQKQWLERQERDRRASEEARQRFEAAEQARIAAEQARLAEEKRLQDAFPQEVRAMYEQFRQAYEARDESRVMSFLADAWQAGDGTSLSDLSANLRRTFTAFDEIRYEISNLQIQPGMGGRMIATYDLSIISRMFSADIRHVEKSAVREEVGRDSRGRVRILSTPGGRFWMVE